MNDWILKEMTVQELHDELADAEDRSDDYCRNGMWKLAEYATRTVNDILNELKARGEV